MWIYYNYLRAVEVSFSLVHGWHYRVGLGSSVYITQVGIQSRSLLSVIALTIVLQQKYLLVVFRIFFETNLKMFQ